MNNNYAGFWIRFAAYFADVLILIIPEFIIDRILRSEFIPTNTDQEVLLELVLFVILKHLIVVLY